MLSWSFHRAPRRGGTAGHMQTPAAVTAWSLITVLTNRLNATALPMCATSEITTLYTLTPLTYRRASQSQRGQSGWGRRCRGCYNHYCGVQPQATLAKRLVSFIRSTVVQACWADRHGLCLCKHEKGISEQSVYKRYKKTVLLILSSRVSPPMSLFLFLNCLAELPVKSWYWLLLLDSTHKMSPHGIFRRVFEWYPVIWSGNCCMNTNTTPINSFTLSLCNCNCPTYYCAKPFQKP